ncbi:MAG: bifunctional oligoribonuclease/PAP phosphatase NrnA [Planctomycetes bacterium]|nr:bifunctional oligoribonuclease/PAP phosphatase NrnA [Planctomycetota bacterium]
MSYAAAAKAIANASSIIVTTHINPDGDGVGAGLALVHALKGMGKQVRFCCPSRVVSMYAFLPGFAKITAVEDEAAAAKTRRADLIISCDAGDVERLGAVAKVKRSTLINLDHHVTNTRFGDLNVVDVDAESTGVVVEKLLRRMKVKLDKTLGECLYTTIVFDTGRFMHSNTTAHTFRWTAKLLETGIDAAAINRALTYTKKPHDLLIQKMGIENLRVDEQEPRLAGIVLSADTIAAVGEPEDWGDLVEIARSLAGNQVAYLLREAKDRKTVRCSMRSNPPFEVGSVAQALGGGGHRQAAGCTFVGNLAAAQREILARLRHQLS